MLKPFLILAVVAVVFSIPIQDNITPRSEETCGYESCPETSSDVLNVHLVPHTHDDVGWLKTVDQYYYGSNNTIQKAGVQYILDSVVRELWEDPKRRFIYVETAFFWKWWVRQTDSIKDKVHTLVRQGRLQFVGGAWSMNDEAASHYQSTIDQFTLGLEKLNKTFGECGRPRVGWQIDPFGHSREFASLLAAMGYDGLFLGRLDYQDKKSRLQNKNMEMIWRGNDDLGEDSDIFTGVLYNTYSPPRGFCFDILCSDDPIVDDPDSPLFNVDERVDQFMEVCKKMSSAYRSNNILVTMGDDFHYQEAGMWFKNIDRLIEYSNLKAAKDGLKMKFMYSTPTCYLKAVRDANPVLPIKQDDFFPYASDPTAFWTGYFSSRPTTKYFEREANNYLQAVKQLQVLADLDKHNVYVLNELRNAMGIMQHHDAITGTEKQHVARDYERILTQAVDDALIISKQAFNKIRQGNSAKQPMFSYDRCHFNESSCQTSESSDNFIVTIYNSLAWNVVKFIDIPVVKADYEIYDHKGVKLQSYLIEIPENIIKYIPTRKSKATHALYFMAELTPLSMTSYYVKKHTKRNKMKRGISDYYKYKIINDNLNNIEEDSKEAERKKLIELLGTLDDIIDTLNQDPDNIEDGNRKKRGISNYYKYKIINDNSNNIEEDSKEAERKKLIELLGNLDDIIDTLNQDPDNIEDGNRKKRGISDYYKYKIINDNFNNIEEDSKEAERKKLIELLGTLDHIIDTLNQDPDDVDDGNRKKRGISDYYKYKIINDNSNNIEEDSKEAERKKLIEILGTLDDIIDTLNQDPDNIEDGNRKKRGISNYYKYKIINDNSNNIEEDSKEAERKKLIELLGTLDDIIDTLNQVPDNIEDGNRKKRGISDYYKYKIINDNSNNIEDDSKEAERANLIEQLGTLDDIIDTLNQDPDKIEDGNRKKRGISDYYKYKIINDNSNKIEDDSKEAKRKKLIELLGTLDDIIDTLNQDPDDVDDGNRKKRDTSMKEYSDNINDITNSFKYPGILDLGNLGHMYAKDKLMVEKNNYDAINSFPNNINNVINTVERQRKVLMEGLERVKNDVKSIRNEVMSHNAFMQMNEEGMHMLSDEPKSEGEVTMSYGFYPGCVGNNEEAANRSSGAYIFRPNSTDPQPYKHNIKVQNIVDNEDFRRTITNIGNELSVVETIFKKLSITKVDWFVRIFIDDGIGKDVVLTYKTGILNNGEFYTDSNGRQMLKRVLNKRPQWNVTLQEPVAGNYYPVVNEIYIENDNERFTVLTDRAEGGTSLVEGEVQLMLHRRLLHDDAFGVGEALNETVHGLPLAAVGTHIVTRSKDEVTIEKTKLELSNHPIVFVSDAKDLVLDDWVKMTNYHTYASTSLPNGLHLLTVEPWGDELLLRIENYMTENSYSTKAVDLKAIFNNIKMTGLRETKLAANQWVGGKKWQWRTENDFVERFNDGYGIVKNSKNIGRDNNVVNDNGFMIHLKAKQIRTFIISYEMM